MSNDWYRLTKSCWSDLTEALEETDGDPAARGLIMLFSPAFIIYTTVAAIVETVGYLGWGVFWLIGKATGA